MSLVAKIAYAATGQTADQILSKIATYILDPIIVFVFALALVYFLVGVVKYIANADSEEERVTGSKHILWGLVGMFIMFSVYGIIRLILNTFGISAN